MEVDHTFHELYEADYRKVFRAAYLACGDSRLAEDAAQEAFVRALERWDRLRSEAYVSAWIMRVALNFALKAARRRFRLFRGSPTPYLEQQLTESELDLWNGILGLTPPQRTAVVIHYFADLRLGDVAGLMGCREGTVKSHLSRARHALRGHLSEVKSD